MFSRWLLYGGDWAMTIVRLIWSNDDCRYPMYDGDWWKTIVRLHLSDGVCTTVIVQWRLFDCLWLMECIGWHVSDSEYQTGVCVKRISDAVCTTMFLDGAYTTVIVRLRMFDCNCSTAFLWQWQSDDGCWLLMTDGVHRIAWVQWRA